MKKYYTFLDLSGLQAGTASMPILGYGLKAPDANILQAQYNKSYSGFVGETTGDESEWIYYPNDLTNPPVPPTWLEENIPLLVGVGVAFLVLVIAIIFLVRYYRKKNEKSRMGHVFQDKLTYYGKQEQKKTLVQKMDFSMEEDESERLTKLGEVKKSKSKMAKQTLSLQNKSVDDEVNVPGDR